MTSSAVALFSVLLSNWQANCWISSFSRHLTVSMKQGTIDFARRELLKMLVYATLIFVWPFMISSCVGILSPVHR
jgi:hypothetical protein